MSPRLDGYAGLLHNVRPLLGAYWKGVQRSLRPVPVSRLPTEAPPELWHTAGEIRISPAQVQSYLAVTDGIDLVGAPGGLLPPLYFTTWFLRPYLNVLSSDALSLNLLGIVHLENELRVHRPLTRSDRITCRVGLESLERNERRVLIAVRCENLVGGELGSESRSLILARLGRGGTRTKKEPEAQPDRSDWNTLRDLRFGEDLGRRYGLLTGDVNPIHLHRLTSQAFGFRRPIAHGFCLKAMVAHALIRSLGRGDIGRLERLDIRFRGVIPLPGQATLLHHGDEFIVTGSDPDRPAAEGKFTIRA